MRYKYTIVGDDKLLLKSKGLAQKLTLLSKNKSKKIAKGLSL